MPMTVNGIGTSVVGSRGDVGWGSYDAMECLVIAFLPIVPYKAMHTFDWNGEQYRHIPIRWSWDLVLRVYLNHWSIGIGIIGIILGIVGVAERANSVGIPLMAGGVFLVLLGVLAQVAVRLSDRRNKSIRRAIGGLTIGSCDPVNLKDDLLEQMTGNTRMLYGTETYTDAVEKLLDEGRYAHAMWAARMATAIEDPVEGERLTDLVLADPEVEEALAEVARNGERWAKVMLTKEERLQVDVRAPGTEYFPPESPDARRSTEKEPQRARKRRPDEA
ncbi:MAG: hypothetical protein U0840_07125 [Gemmataceae bacterium]